MEKRLPNYGDIVQVDPLWNSTERPQNQVRGFHRVTRVRAAQSQSGLMVTAGGKELDANWWQVVS